MTFVTTGDEYGPERKVNEAQEAESSGSRIIKALKITQRLELRPPAQSNH
jgi:hypothetical protein